MLSLLLYLGSTIWYILFLKLISLYNLIEKVSRTTPSIAAVGKGRVVGVSGSRYATIATIQP